MTPDQVQAIDDALRELGIAYHASAEAFLREEAPVDSEEILAALPHLSLNDLAAYEQARQEPTRLPDLPDAEHNPNVANRESEIRLEDRNL